MSLAKSIGLSVLRLFGFKRRPPQTRLGKYAGTSERALTAIALLYLGLICFPQPLFAYNVSTNGVTVYSRAPLPAQTTTRISEAMALVARSELSVPGRSERIFVCDNPWLYRLFAPVSPRAFAVSWPVIDNIFIAPSDPAQNVTQSAAENYNRRSFSSVMAHEITHGLIRHRLGLIRGIRLSDWVAEGYCDYVARESSFPEERGVQILRDGKDEPSASFRYFVFRQMVRHLMDDRHYSFDQVAARAGDAAAVKSETIAALKQEAWQ